MNVIVNGRPRELPTGSSVSSLLSDSGHAPDKVAVELNRRLLKSEKYAVELADGDEIEIVTFVGGG